MAPATEQFPMGDIIACCKRFSVKELSVFGSTARGDARPDSDVDLLVEFEPDAEIGFIALAQFTQELSGLLDRKVDVVTKRGLRPAFRDEVLAEARVVYAA